MTGHCQALIFFVRLEGIKRLVLRFVSSTYSINSMPPCRLESCLLCIHGPPIPNFLALFTIMRSDDNVNCVSTLNISLVCPL